MSAQQPQRLTRDQLRKGRAYLQKERRTKAFRTKAAQLGSLTSDEWPKAIASICRNPPPYIEAVLYYEINGLIDDPARLNVAVEAGAMKKVEASPPENDDDDDEIVTPEMMNDFIDYLRKWAESGGTLE